MGYGPRQFFRHPRTELMSLLVKLGQSHQVQPCTSCPVDSAVDCDVAWSLCHRRAAPCAAQDLMAAGTRVSVPSI